MTTRSPALGRAALYPGGPAVTIKSPLQGMTDRDALVTLADTVPKFEKKDVRDNITWHPDLTVLNTKVSGATMTDNTALNSPLRVRLEKSSAEPKVENNVVETN